MTRSSHEELIAAFAELTQLEAERLMRGDSFAVNDIECAMLVKPDGAKSILICQVDFGIPPVERRDEIFACLLELNYLQSSQGVCFAVAPGTGNVVCVLNLPIDQLSAESLADIFEAVAAQAHSWREHHFLDGENEIPSQKPDTSSITQLA
jgi:hypothetical protein